MTKNQRKKRFNNIKIIIYYSIAKIAQYISYIGILTFLLLTGVDDINLSYVIIFSANLAIVAISNFIASRLSRYLYKKHAIPKAKIIDSIFYEIKEGV